MYEIYTVKFGDNINNLANLYNTTVDELVKINGIIDLNNLKEGMQIIVPNKEDNIYKYYTVKKGDTLYSIADKNNIDMDLLISINGLEVNDYIYPNQTLILPREDVVLYLTSDNDTITSIIDKYNIGLEDLIKNNKNIYLREEQILVLSNK